MIISCLQSLSMKIIFHMLVVPALMKAKAGGMMNSRPPWDIVGLHLIKKARQKLKQKYSSLINQQPTNQPTSQAQNLS